MLNLKKMATFEMLTHVAASLSHVSLQLFAWAPCRQLHELQVESIVLELHLGTVCNHALLPGLCTRLPNGAGFSKGCYLDVCNGEEDSLMVCPMSFEGEGAAMDSRCFQYLSGLERDATLCFFTVFTPAGEVGS